jgi:hypothetical protein
MKYYDSDNKRPPIRLSLCLEKSADSVKLVEPIDHLVHAIQRCVVLRDSQVFPNLESYR